MDALVETLGGASPLGRLVAHGVGQRRQPLDLGLLADGQLGQTNLVGGSRLAILGIAALVLDDPGLVEVQDSGDGLVQEVQVVADDQQGAAVGPQETHEPVLGVAVEVVGRLVKEEHVAPGKQDAGQLDPAPFAPGKDPERTIDAIGAQARVRPRSGELRTRRRNRPEDAKASSARAKRAMARSEGCSSMAIRSFSSWVAASSRPRPDKIWARPVAALACRAPRGS